MKVLTFAHRLEVGGTQVNAIEIARALRDIHGHEPLIYATPGPMLTLIEQSGLPFVAAPDVRFHPSAKRIRHLRKLVAVEKPDIIHAWDWWQGLEAYISEYLPNRTPVLITDMMMDLTRVLPKQVPTTFGTTETLEAARRGGWRKTYLLLPPVDVHDNAPTIDCSGDVRSTLGISGDELVIVSVSRLSVTMKSETVQRAIGVVRRLAREVNLRLVVVGDGEARRTIEELAAEANREVGREVVTLMGALLRPNPVYQIADVVLGMGGSALRGLAFGKPVIVVGEAGFARVVSAETEEYFRRYGFYGRGPNTSADLEAAVKELVTDRQRRVDLGLYGRAYILKHHSLAAISGQLSRFFDEVVGEAPTSRMRLTDAARTAAVYLRERRFKVASRDAWLRPNG